MTEANGSMRQSRILACGVARNCEKSLAATIEALYCATKSSAEVIFHIVESDSSDRTLPVLKELSEQYPLTFQSEGSLRSAMRSRTERIAHCRNKLVDFAKANELERFTYVLMADLDGVNDSISRSDLASCWEVEVPWDVLTANQLEGYYDVWALRCEGWLVEDCWAAARRLEAAFGKKRAVDMAVRSRQICIPASTTPIEVESAFGGLGLYRRTAFVSGRFRGLTADGEQICEHVPFNGELRTAGFKIFINPALLNTSPPEHIKSSLSLSRVILEKLRLKATLG